MDSYKGITALITGASSGIGESFARQLAERGANLVITARSADKLEAMEKELAETHGVQVSGIAEDLSAEGASERIMSTINDAGLSIDLLINNAGFGKWGKFLDVDPETYRQMIVLNVTAVVELTHLCLPRMLEKGDGGVIIVGSTASFVPIPYSSVYGATKAFDLMFSEGLYGEVAHKGVHVMALCPGGTETGFASVASDEAKAADSPMDSPDFVAKEGLDEFLKGTCTHIPGKHNRRVTIPPRLMRREKVIQVVKKTWTKVLADRGLMVD